MHSSIILLGLAVVFGATYFSPWVFSVKVLGQSHLVATNDHTKVGPRQSYNASEDTQEANGMHTFLVDEMAHLAVDPKASKPDFAALDAKYGTLANLCEEVQGDTCPEKITQCVLATGGCTLGWIRFYFTGGDGNLDDSEKDELMETMKAFAGATEKLNFIKVGNMATVVGYFAGVDGALDPNERSALKKTINLYEDEDEGLTEQARGDLLTAVKAFRVGAHKSKFNEDCLNEHEFNLFMAVVDNDIRMSADIDKGSEERPISTLVDEVIKTWLLAGVERLPDYDEKVKAFGAEAKSYVNLENGKMVMHYAKASEWGKAHRETAHLSS